MKPSFIQFAEKAQESIDREYKLIQKSTEELDVERREVAQKASQLLDKEILLNSREKDLDARAEEVVRKELLIKDLDQAKADRENATSERQAAEKALLQAQSIEGQNMQKEAELYKREVALSEEKKTYMDKLKKEFVNSVIGRVI